MMGHLFKGDTKGKVSMMRVATAMVVSSIMGVWVAHNVVAMIAGSGFVSMGAEEAMLIALTLGAKAAQHFGESRGSGKSSSTTDSIPTDKTQ